LLNSHPAISCLWDIFWGEGKTDYCFNTYLASRNLRRVPRFFGRSRLLSDYLSRYYAKFTDVEAAGFLLKWRNVRQYPEVLKWLSDNDVKIVHIVRENSLIHQVALQLRRSGIVRHHSRTDIEFSRVSLDVKSIVRELRTWRRRLERHRALLRGADSLEIHYESLLANEAAGVRRVLEFLGVNPEAALVSEFRKTESESPVEMIENYEEVFDALAHTEFRALLST
jgi:hypothetical protein